MSKKYGIYELLYYLNPVVKVKGSMLGLLTRNQFAELMKDPKNWASRVGSAAQYNIDEIEPALSNLVTMRLVIRFTDPEDKKRKLFITGELTEGNTYNMGSKALSLIDDCFNQIHVQ